MINGIKIDKGISVSKEFVIVDGHHRYLASLLASFESAPSIKPLSLAKDLVDWKTVKVDDTDWDSEASIGKHNKIDARYSGITVKQLLELIG